MGLISEEMAQELSEKLEMGFSEQDPTPSVTEDVKPEVEAAPAAEEVVEARADTPEVPADQPDTKTDTGKSEEQAEALADDGSAEEESASPGHRVPYKRFKNVLEARNKYREEVDGAQAQVEAMRQQMQSMRNEVAMMRNLRPAQPVESSADASDELDRLLNGAPDLPKEVQDKLSMMEARLHQQEVHAERVRLRQEVADVTSNYDKNLTADIQQVLYSAVQRDPNVDLNRVAEQYTTWLAKREEEAIARYLEANPGASTAEAAESATEAESDVPSRPKRAGTGASRVATTADKKTYGSIKEGTEALFKAVKNGNINLFG
jgi:hypothetical protein